MKHITPMTQRNELPASATSLLVVQQVVAIITAAAGAIQAMVNATSAVINLTEDIFTKDEE